MGWDGSGNVVRNNGVFTGQTVWQQSRDAGRKVRADDHDTHDEDLAQTIENTVTRDGQNSPTTNLPMGNNRHTGCGDAVSLTDYCTLKQEQAEKSHVCTVTGGTANDIILTADFPPSAYDYAQKFIFISEQANTGAVTLNVSGLGQVAVKKRAGADLEADDIVASELVVVYYDGSSFQLATLSNQGLGKIGDQKITSFDPGSGSGPQLDLFRNSPSPSVNDQLGELKFTGTNSVPAEKILYALMSCQILDQTSGQEAARLDLRTIQAGSRTTRLYIGSGLYMASVSGGDKGQGTINAKELYTEGNQHYLLSKSLSTPQSTTSGTQINFTGIRSDAQRVTVIFNETSGSSGNLFVQIGTSSTVEETGYGSDSSETSSSSTSLSQLTTGFVVRSGSSRPWSGTMVLEKLSDSANTWISSHTGRMIARTVHGGGVKTLSGDFGRVKVGVLSGAFDGGSVNIRVE